mgnify:FL=1
MKKVVITSKGNVIRTSEDGSVTSDSEIESNEPSEDKIMWDFKLKKTRIIFIGSVVWLLLIIPITEEVLYLSDSDEIGFQLLFLVPIVIYWIAIPLYRWIMKGK